MLVGGLGVVHVYKLSVWQWVYLDSNTIILSVWLSNMVPTGLETWENSWNSTSKPPGLKRSGFSEILAFICDKSENLCLGKVVKVLERSWSFVGTVNHSWVGTMDRVPAVDNTHIIFIYTPYLLWASQHVMGQMLLHGRSIHWTVSI